MDSIFNIFGDLFESPQNDIDYPINEQVENYIDYPINEHSEIVFQEICNLLDNLIFETFNEQYEDEYQKEKRDCVIKTQSYLYERSDRDNFIIQKIMSLIEDNIDDITFDQMDFFIDLLPQLFESNFTVYGRIIKCICYIDRSYLDVFKNQIIDQINIVTDELKYNLANLDQVDNLTKNNTFGPRVNYNEFNTEELEKIKSLKLVENYFHNCMNLLHLIYLNSEIGDSNLLKKWKNFSVVNLTTEIFYALYNIDELHDDFCNYLLGIDIIDFNEQQLEMCKNEYSDFLQITNLVDSIDTLKRIISHGPTADHIEILMDLKLNPQFREKLRRISMILLQRLGPMKPPDTIESELEKILGELETMLDDLRSANSGVILK